MLKILIAEYPDGTYEPIGLVDNTHEGEEIAAQDMRRRIAGIDRGGEVPCPELYRLWKRNTDGAFVPAASFDPAEITAPLPEVG